MGDDFERRPVAIVTGAARGLGANISRGLAAAGWHVVLFDVCSNDPNIPYPLATLEDMEETLVSCRSVGGHRDQVVAVTGDVRRLEDVKAAVSTAVERFGGLDAAVAAAGVIAGGTPAWETTEEAWNTLLDVNLRGVWHLARAAIQALLAQPKPRRGRFIAISSAAGLRGFPQLAAYSAAKHGVVGLVRSIAVELGETGVTANVVCPGSMDTAMLSASAGVYGLVSRDEFAKYHVTNRLLDSGEVANLVVWLCSKESSGITGAVLPVDGGMTAK